MHEKYRYKINAAALIEDLGGAPETARLLSDMGSEVKMKAVQKMRERNMMQSDVVATLMAGTARLGKRIDLYQYLLERND